MCDCNKQAQPERKPHVHADVIRAWADGAAIEFLVSTTGEWRKSEYPAWNEDTKYRVKPEPKPLTDLEKYAVEVGDVWINHNRGMITHIYGLDGTAGIRIYYQESARPAAGVRCDLHTLLFRRGVVNKL